MKTLCPYSLANQAIEEKLSMPPRPSHLLDDVIPTLNNKGFMANFTDEITEEFINQSISKNTTHLEIGAAFGNVAIKSLKNGCKKYIANDLDLNHLKILARRVKESNPASLDSLSLMHGSYPEETKLENESIDSILISRVLHFLSPEEIIILADDVRRILKQNGKLYILCGSPYNQAFKQFISTFESRKKRKMKYYGYTENREEYLDQNLTDKNKLNGLQSGKFHFFDLDSFAEYFNDNGLRIERTIYLPYQKDSIFALDGREGVGAIITKD